jgi:hypothetical protein
LFSVKRLPSPLLVPEMNSWAKVVEQAEEEYMPSGPPMSPLTTIFFTTQAFYDLKIGNGRETLTTCLIDSSDVVMMNPCQLGAMKILSGSRMWIYEHVGMEGPHVRLWELISDDEVVSLSTSAYQGRKGELWYLRFLPPLEPELAAYHIVFTTPYILIQSSSDDWTQFLKRSLVKVPARNQRESLYALLRHGLGLHHWNGSCPRRTITTRPMRFARRASPT